MSALRALWDPQALIHLSSLLTLETREDSAVSVTHVVPSRLARSQPFQLLAPQGLARTLSFQLLVPRELAGTSRSFDFWYPEGSYSRETAGYYFVRMPWIGRAVAAVEEQARVRDEEQAAARSTVVYCCIMLMSVGPSIEHTRPEDSSSAAPATNRGGGGNRGGLRSRLGMAQAIRRH